MTKSKQMKKLRKLEDAFDGVKLSLEELKELSVIENKEACGWIGHPMYDKDLDVFMGSCRMVGYDLKTKSVPKCYFPSVLPSWREDKYKDFNCPRYLHLMRVQRRKNE